MNKDTERAARQAFADHELIEAMWPAWLAAWQAALAQEAQAVPKRDRDAIYRKALAMDDEPSVIGGAATAPQSVPAQPVGWRYVFTNDLSKEWHYLTAGPDTDKLRLGIPGILNPDSSREQWQPLLLSPVAQQDVPRALTGEQRQALGVALTNYFTAYDEGEEHEYQILSSWDYHDARNIDHLIDRVIVRALTAAGAK